MCIWALGRSTRKNCISTSNAVASQALASMTIVARISIRIDSAAVTYPGKRTDFREIVISTSRGCYEAIHPGGGLGGFRVTLGNLGVVDTQRPPGSSNIGRASWRERV